MIHGIDASIEPSLQAETSALVRSHLYALYSTLVASPYVVDVPALVSMWVNGQAHLLDTELPYSFPRSMLRQTLHRLTDTPRSELKLEYTRLFESTNGPLQICETSALEQVDRAGEIVRREILRMYDSFGYTLPDPHPLAPDHLSVELEFMQVLCTKEALAVDADGRLAAQRTQHQFLSEHLMRWVPAVVEQTVSHDADSIYALVLATLDIFLTADQRWVANRTDLNERISAQS